MIVAGFDEAGYGPKLGPLVVGYSAFWVDGARLDQRVDLWERLAPAVRREGRGDKGKVWVADSKAIKPRKNGLQQLEWGVLAFRGLERQPKDLAALLCALGDERGCEGQAWFKDLSAVQHQGNNVGHGLELTRANLAP